MLDSLKATWLQKNENQLVFQYRTIRLLVGIIVILLPVLVTYFSGEDNLTSISVSYYSNARDAFVGLLFVVGAFLMAYRGHYFYEGIASIIASFAAFLVAIAPTECDPLVGIDYCEYKHLVTENALVHVLAAGTMFLILAYFCFYPFRLRAKEKYEFNKNDTWAFMRQYIYIICGILILLAILGIVAFKLNFGIHHPKTVYVAEFVALIAFGVAWFVAGLPFNSVKP